MMSWVPLRGRPGSRSSPLIVMRPTTPASLRDGSRPSLGVGGASVAGASVAGAGVGGAGVAGAAVTGAAVGGAAVTVGWVASGGAVATGGKVVTGCGVLVAAGAVVTQAAVTVSTARDRPNERMRFIGFSVQGRGLRNLGW